MMRKIILGCIGTAISVIPPLAAAACYFPLWIEKGGDTVLSGFGVFIAIIAFVPLLKLLGRILESPAAWMMWLLFFILFLALSSIADEMVVISFVGTVSNIISAILFKLADGGKKE